MPDSREAILEECQLRQATAMGGEPILWRWLRKLRRTARVARRIVRRGGGARATTPEVVMPASDDGASTSEELRAGDRVRVRSREAIERTLDAGGRCHGCAFLSPMARHCGQVHTVARVVRRFFDESRWRMLKCNNLVLLENVYCDGSGARSTRGCDRMCFLFWRREWLEPIESTS